MKHIFHFAAFIFLITACHKQESASVLQSFDKYIFFSQTVETKSSLIESAEAMGKFGVIGFKNNAEWDAVKETGITPNVFGVNDDVIIQEVTCASDGTGSYSPLKGWYNNMKYTFFAYYPCDHSNVLLVNTDGDPYTSGTPAIKYSLVTDNPATTDINEFLDSMTDVMTAPFYKDKYWYSASANNLENSELTFGFTHRLAALGINIKNSTSGEIAINSINLKLSGLIYSDILIPLDGSRITRTSAANQSIEYNLPFTILDNEKNITSSEEKELSDKMILIPQDSAISIQVEISYTRKQVGGYAEYTSNLTLPTTLSTKLLESKNHLINLNFTDSTVGVTISMSGWKDSHEVEDTFN